MVKLSLFSQEGHVRKRKVGNATLYNCFRSLASVKDPWTMALRQCNPRRVYIRSMKVFAQQFTSLLATSVLS